MKKRQIAILGYYHGPRLGVGVLMDHLVTALASRPDLAGDLVYYTNRNTLGNMTGEISDVTIRTPRMLEMGSLAAVVWSAIVFPLVCYFRRIDVCLILANAVVVLPLVRTVSVIADLNEFEIEAKYGRLRSWYRKHIMLASSVANSRRLVAISDFVSRQLTRCFPHVESRKVSVIYPGGGIRVVNSENTTVTPDCSTNATDAFYLVVGRIDPRGKNLYSVLRLYKALEGRFPGHELLFAGGINESTHHEAEKFLDHIESDPDLAGRVRYLGYVSDEKLADLYRKARATILFSAVEGFGFPMVEAFRHGCPVIYNAACEALADNAHGCAIGVDETAVDRELPDELEFLFDPQGRASMTVRMKEVAAMFSWDRCAADFATVLEEVAP